MTNLIKGKIVVERSSISVAVETVHRPLFFYPPEGVIKDLRSRAQRKGWGGGSS